MNVGQALETRLDDFKKYKEATLLRVVTVSIEVSIEAGQAECFAACEGDAECLNAQFSVNNDGMALCELCADFGTGALVLVAAADYEWWITITKLQAGRFSPYTVLL